MKSFKRKIRAQKKLVQSFSSSLRVLIVLVSCISIGFLSYNAFTETDIQEDVFAGKILGETTERTNDALIIESPNGVVFTISQPSDEEFKDAEEKLVAKRKRIEEEKRLEEERLKRIRQEKVTAMNTYLVNYGSPMAPYSDEIIQVCEKYGTHYCRFFMSIAGVESGLGRICPPHNAWGWGGISYPSWEYSIPHVASQIATYYYYEGYDTFEKLADSPYGAHNKELWIKNLYQFYNSMPTLSE